MSTKWLIIFIAIASTAQAQSFNSRSTGADGALALTIPGTVVFDPHHFNPPLNPSADNVYHFTFVYIGKGVTLKLSANALNSSLFWLAQGPVQIDGLIDLNGEDGGGTPSNAGAGGYPGGAPHKPGYGPGDAFKSNPFLVPLVGGSGGAGGQTHGGGAGGGALLIASSTSITVNGAIMANGGASTDGVGGNGGAIRLVAPTIEGENGALSAKGGRIHGVDGRIRFEAFQNLFTGNLNDTPFSQGKPFGLFLPPTPPPSAHIVSIGGTAVSKPEITLSKASPLLVLVEAQNVPTGTIMNLQCFSDNGAERTFGTTPLEGTFERSHANAVVTFTAGPSRCYVQANWKQPLLQGR